MSSFFTGRIPDWGSAATGDSAATARMQERRARGAFMNEIRGVGSMGDYENTGDWWRAATMAGANAWSAYREAGGTHVRPSTPFQSRDISLAGYNEKVRGSGSVLQGSIVQPPKVGSPQQGNSTDVRAMLKQRLVRRFPGTT